MPIKKRGTTKPAGKKVAKTYDEFRISQWEAQGGAKPWNFRAGTRSDGGDITQSILQPKEHAFYKDIWHCVGKESAKQLSITILKFESVVQLEMKGRWVYVDWTGKGPWLLPGQKGDDRDTVTG